MTTNQRPAVVNFCRWQPQIVTLCDGRQVPSDDPAWLDECYARMILSWPIAKRREFLYGKRDALGEPKGGIKQRKGDHELKRLEALLTRVWQSARNNNNGI